MHDVLREFRFLDPGPLVDGDLELVVPAQRWIDGMLASVQHPLTRDVAPREALVTREMFERFIMEFPLGRHKPDPARGLVPAYSFWMHLLDPSAPAAMAGGVTLRIGHTRDLEMYLGHVGYGVYPPARGRHLAERSVRLLYPLAKRHGINPLWITCNPDNYPSRRTCERLGATLVEIVDLPDDHPLYLRGEREKCRYRVDL